MLGDGGEQRDPPAVAGAQDDHPHAADPPLGLVDQAAVDLGDRQLQLGPVGVAAPDRAAGQLDHGDVGGAEAGDPPEADVAGGELEAGQRLAGRAGDAAVEQAGDPVVVGVEEQRLLGVEVPGGPVEVLASEGVEQPFGGRLGRGRALGGARRLAGGVQADPAEQQQHGDQAGDQPGADPPAPGRRWRRGPGGHGRVVGHVAAPCRRVPLKDRPTRRSRWGPRRSKTVAWTHPACSGRPRLLRRARPGHAWPVRPDHAGGGPGRGGAAAAGGGPARRQGQTWPRPTPASRDRGDRRDVAGPPTVQAAHQPDRRPGSTIITTTKPIRLPLKRPRSMPSWAWAWRWGRARELDGVVPAVGARVVLGQRVAALPADAAEREALLAALAGAGVGSGALHRASLGAHVIPRSSAGQASPARPPWRRPQSLPPRPGRRKGARTEPPGQR